MAARQGEKAVAWSIDKTADESAAAGWTAVRPREYHIDVVRGRPVLAGTGFLSDLSDEATMEIRFPADAPAYRDSNLTVVFPALVDGEPVPCAISVEALEDHFGARSISETDLVDAFAAHRGAIEEAAATLIEATHGAPVVLHSGVFRMMEDDARKAGRSRAKGRSAS